MTGGTDVLQMACQANTSKKRRSVLYMLQEQERDIELPMDTEGASQVGARPHTYTILTDRHHVRAR